MEGKYNFASVPIGLSEGKKKLFMFYSFLYFSHSHTQSHSHSYHLLSSPPLSPRLLPSSFFLLYSHFPTILFPLPSSLFPLLSSSYLFLTSLLSIPPLILQMKCLYSVCYCPIQVLSVCLIPSMKLLCASSLLIIMI